MRRRLTRLAAGVVVLVGSSLALEPVGASGAASIDDSGWWWKLQAGPGLLLPGPPTVAEGQLLVQGTPDGASAIAAIAATLVEGEVDPVLTLAVAEGGDTGGDQAVLLACQAGSQWTGGDAKAWSEKPQPACDAGGVEGQRSVDGASWTFDLSALQFGDEVNVVLVPGTVEGQPEGANGSAFSLTFDAPTSDAIQSTEGALSLPPPPALVDGSGYGDFGSPATSDAFESFEGPIGGGSISLPPVKAALPEAEQGLTPVAPSVQDRTPLLPAAVAVDPRSPHARAVGVLLLLLGGAAVYLTTRRQVPIGPEGVPGGLGRWARPRWGSPPALRG
jgi:hypothetical protein